MVEIRVDCGAQRGRIRALHGANNGPRCFGGLVDLSASYREAGFPAVRLHDCEWPADSYVDVHAVFPRFEADPEDPANYDFRLTDEYLEAIAALGIDIVYRLGCRIEHTTHRRHAHPPADFEQWARICRGIVRHCNEGWADGRRLGIRRWEIWNEPDIPPGCWSGTWDDYIRLYLTASRLLKDHDPALQIGGPAYSYATEEHGFVEQFLARVRDAGAPLDFFSWHTYAGRDLQVWGRHARAMRELLDRHGFTGTPSHLNEWNCCPDGDWGDLPLFHRGMTGSRGASGVAMSLTLFQDLPIDEAFIYTADTQVYGMHTLTGERQTNWYALRAFSMMTDTPVRLAAAVDGDRVAVLAGASDDGGRVQLLLSRYVGEGDDDCRIELEGPGWAGGASVTILGVDERRRLDPVAELILERGERVIALELPEATVRLIRLEPKGEK